MKQLSIVHRRIVAVACTALLSVAALSSPYCLGASYVYCQFPCLDYPHAYFNCCASARESTTGGYAGGYCCPYYCRQVDCKFAGLNCFDQGGIESIPAGPMVGPDYHCDSNNSGLCVYLP